MKEYFCTQKAIPKELPKKKQKKLDTSGKKWEKIQQSPDKRPVICIRLFS